MLPKETQGAENCFLIQNKAALKQIYSDLAHQNAKHS